MSYLISNPLFNMGMLAITPGASNLLSAQEIQTALDNHFSGDWGTVDEADKIRNDQAIENCGTIHSRYLTHENEKIYYVISDAGHGATTVLLPNEV